MTMSKSVTKSQNYGDGCTSGASPWSDLDHDLLYLVMMQLGAFDFIAFSGVCKSWRSLALSNKTRFMASRPPMPIWIFEQAIEKEYSAEDFDGRQVKMHIPKSGGKTCVGLTCGYLVMFGRKPREFWLMNPITMHGFRFPKVPSNLDPDPEEVRAILVFSPSISAWVFVVLCRYTSKIWFSIAGKREWNYVSSTSDIIDLLDFKGKIYAIDDDSCLYELRLDPKPKLMLLKTKNILESVSDFLQLVSSGENIYAVECFSFDNQVHKLDLDEMLWVSPEEKTLDEYVFYASDFKRSAAIKRELWSDSWFQHYKKFAYSYTSGNGMFFTASIWYFPHDCLKVNLKQK